METVPKPADANEHIKSAYRTIGDPVNPHQENLLGHGSVTIGEVLNADDLDSGPTGEHDGDPIRLGDPLGADVTDRSETALTRRFR
jgi:hypothetical protein